MNAPTKPTYGRSRRGPNVIYPFTVTKGMVAIEGAERVSIVIPQGGTWPGTDNLCDLALDTIMAGDSFLLSPDTETSPTVTPAQIEEGVRLVTVQLLSRGQSFSRLDFLRNMDVDTSRTTDQVLGYAVGIKRETMTKVRREWVKART
ncbi:hypothetical protein [Deinococcus kurensis]|uniref:hypothetical protein n=1 Tax=Deinococcus kurensis TaxID=2662757 RepID=UPI0012D3673D|nr:hypothetical protein [Deinococcus kurensis]